MVQGRNTRQHRNVQIPVMHRIVKGVCELIYIRSKVGSVQREASFLNIRTKPQYFSCITSCIWFRVWNSNKEAEGRLTSQTCCGQTTNVEAENDTSDAIIGGQNHSRKLVQLERRCSRRYSTLTLFIFILTQLGRFWLLMGMISVPLFWFHPRSREAPAHLRDESNEITSGRVSDSIGKIARYFAERI